MKVDMPLNKEIKPNLSIGQKKKKEMCILHHMKCREFQKVLHNKKNVLTQFLCLNCICLKPSKSYREHYPLILKKLYLLYIKHMLYTEISSDLQIHSKQTHLKNE